MAKKIKKIIIDEYTNIKCDSTHELAFIWWLLELFNADYIKSFKRSNTIELMPKILYLDEHSKEKILLRSLSYTPDFDIIWNEKAKNIFFNFIDKDKNILNCKIYSIEKRSVSDNEFKYRSVIDIKNPFDKIGVKTLFKIKQKIALYSKNIYINEVEIQDLFFNTFTPNRYLLDDKGNRKRPIRFQTRTLNDFINDRY